MDDSFERKKYELVRKVNEINNSKDQVLFGITEMSMTSTWDFASYTENASVSGDEIVIKRSKLTYLFISICLFFYDAFLIKNYNSSPDFLKMLIIVFVAGVFIYTLLLGLIKRPFFVLNKTGIWINKMNCLYEWRLIGATYIKEEQRGEDKASILVIYYYEPSELDFDKVEYIFPSFMNYSIPQIAYFIEYWKIQSGYRTPVI